MSARQKDEKGRKRKKEKTRPLQLLATAVPMRSMTACGFGVQGVWRVRGKKEGKKGGPTFPPLYTV